MRKTETQTPQERSRFDQMRTEELRAILSNDFRAAPQDRLPKDVILHILEVITQREAEDPDAEPLDIAADWASFREHYLPSASRAFLWGDGTDYDGDADPAAPQKVGRVSAIPAWLRRTVATAAAIFLVVCTATLTAKALGVDIWAHVISWTEEKFYSDPVESPRDRPKTLALRNLLEENGIPAYAAPTYLPEGYEQYEVGAENFPTYTEVYGTYFCEDSYIDISITRYLDANHSGWQYQKDEGDPIILTHEGVDFYIMTNCGAYLAVWMYDDIEGSISGVPTEEELRMMIESIGAIDPTA